MWRPSPACAGAASQLWPPDVSILSAQVGADVAGCRPEICRSVTRSTESGTLVARGRRHRQWIVVNFQCTTQQPGTEDLRTRQGALQMSLRRRRGYAPSTTRKRFARQVDNRAFRTSLKTIGSSGLDVIFDKGDSHVTSRHGAKNLASCVIWRWCSSLARAAGSVAA